MITYDVIIIGSGPAGMFAGLNIDLKKKVLLLEKNATLGKKLLISGSGKCNLTHDGRISDFLIHYGKLFLKAYLLPHLYQLSDS